MSQPSTPPRTALVLAGGGARGAYQVGVLRGLAELGVLDRSASGLDTFCGSSAGAINSSILAAHAGAPVAGIDKLEKLWGGISASDVFRTDVRSLGQIGVQWAWDLTFGGMIGGGTQKALLDTTPLRGFLKKHIPFRQLDAQIDDGSLYALAISATDLASGDGVLFLHGRPEIEEWQRRRWHLRRTAIGAEHVMASSAIPILFPSVEVAGRHYGDGSVRNTAPLSPAINLGAERIVAVSVRERTRPAALAGPSPAPTIAQVAAVLLDAVLLDAVEVDVDHSARVNRSVVSVEDDAGGRGRLRSIDVLWIQPSVDIAHLAAEHAHSIPGVVRYLMRGLGSAETITDLASYLLFDATFCRTLIEAGKADAHASRDEVLAFFAGRPAG